MIVVETSALVAIVTAEPDWETLLGLIAHDSDPLLPAHCLQEAHMVVTGRFGAEMITTLDCYVEEAGLEILPFSNAHLKIARQAFMVFGKGRHPAKLNFGDCMSYGVAQAEGLPLLWAGGDFGLTDVGRA